VRAAHVPCARPGEQGHGPCGLWTRTVKGEKSRGQYIPVEQVDQVRAELDDYAQFTGLVDDYVEINEVLCKAKIGPPPAAGRKRARLADTDGERSGSAPRAGKQGPPTI